MEALTEDVVESALVAPEVPSKIKDPKVGVDELFIAGYFRVR
jgi:hypothetical protein